MPTLARDTVQPGETIVSLSQRLLGNPFRWRDLVRLNRLEPPYLTPEPHRGCLSPGDSVLYPPRPGASPAVDTSALVARTYKRDLLTEHRDLVLRDGRLMTVVGLPNLQGAVSRRIRTLLGRHPFHPMYGSLALTHLGRPADAIRLRLLCLDTRRAVLDDPRVADCEVHALWDNEVLHVDVTVTPIPPGQAFRLRVPVSTA